MLVLVVNAGSSSLKSQLIETEGKVCRMKCLAEKVGGTKVESWESWNPASEGCAEAKFENGAVVWNMGETFIPADGYTYQVRFKVWPSQEAYDLLADLNNSSDPAAAQ